MSLRGILRGFGLKVGRLTVCLVVLGRHVERLAFLDVIFGDAPPLTQIVRSGPTPWCVDEPRQRRIKETIDEVIEDLSDHVEQPLQRYRARALCFGDVRRLFFAAIVRARLAQIPGQSSRRRCRTCRSPASRPAGRTKSQFSASPAAVFSMKRLRHYLRRSLNSTAWGEGRACWALTAGRISSLSAEGVRLVCLSYFDADLSTAGARFAVRRLRRRLGEVKILAGFWLSGPGQANEFCAGQKRISVRRGSRRRSLFVSRGGRRNNG